MHQELLSSVIYQIFVRDFSDEGDFQGVIRRLDYIKSLGVDIVYLMPIHPIGKLNRKGSVGSPYANYDYEAINPDFGTKDDFRELIDETHKRGMKLIIDVVYNHTSCDSVLSIKHPEWFYHDKNGNFGNKAGDWSDVIDLDHTEPGLEEYLSNVLKGWVSFGVDGFRFDVASLIPDTFYEQAKAKCKSVNPDVIFLGEAVDAGFINYVRSIGFRAYSNAELFASGFDLLYHYASWAWLREFLFHDREKDLAAYRAAYQVEEASCQEDGIIVRAIENHDYPRIASYRDGYLPFTKNLIAYSFFTRGTAFLYAGEEDHASKALTLFEKDTIDWHDDKDYQAFVAKLIGLKKRPINQGLRTSDMLDSDGKTLVLVNNYPDHKEYGFFNLDTKPTAIAVPGELKGRKMVNLLTGDAMVLEETLTLDEPLYLA